ncbi:methyltransferase-like protein 27 [Denticeps clupeoides]|uniref:methyltransferase-like protein 27 n=1 Tax=Denticeps clupeoides TaxID=299321 RepID=UPI0010A3EF3B|nr:methyltransferase-like protein 27 [Denticeps clupeoides]XP_028823538.1 methyltransferase-like protein 27 [Denticeps clupeoides]XP_028823539.1 methyltransferase-like protein 27 [Denticeps clupeoides]XP_028823540.1 methyltransferase-like protein 27 [Denticeps clupeoides]XP_028823546.1 methyltransferase-like protein 27 [Denticeps clupeoides]XP_028823547.1 methyltransferase-like protein 27 [Denticeps clupeoides]XP_028823548.1 methyltransferase-like protein 27 [Denticeps clupeoides]
MCSPARTFVDVKKVILSAHEDTGALDKVGFYDSWAENYEQDVAILDYRAPALAAQCVSAFFQGDRSGAEVLDVACGTGLVSAQLRETGFQLFTGVDGSEAMLQVAKSRGIYQNLHKCILGTEQLPVQSGLYDVVVIVGALSVGQVPVSVLQELWLATKPGGYVCMTTRGNSDNLDYKAELEHALGALEGRGCWRRVAVMEVAQWERAVSHLESGYIPGAVFLYQKRAA